MQGKSGGPPWSATGSFSSILQLASLNTSCAWSLDDAFPLLICQDLMDEILSLVQRADIWSVGVILYAQVCSTSLCQMACLRLNWISPRHTFRCIPGFQIPQYDCIPSNFKQDWLPSNFKHRRLAIRHISLADLWPLPLWCQGQALCAQISTCNLLAPPWVACQRSLQGSPEASAGCWPSKTNQLGGNSGSPMVPGKSSPRGTEHEWPLPVQDS